MTTARSPSSGYTGPVFFGGVTGSVSVSTWLIQNNAAGDYINSGGTSTGVGSRVSMVVMFTNETATITAMVWNVRAGGITDSQTNLVSLVVRKTDGSFYISETMSKRASVTVTNQNLESLAWYNYDPTVSLNERGSLVSGFTLDSINAVGEWQESIVTVAGGSCTPGITTFQAFGLTIPEPATIGMLGFGSLTALLIRRHMRP
jgi:hypothetical protein